MGSMNVYISMIVYIVLCIVTVVAPLFVASDLAELKKDYDRLDVKGSGLDIVGDAARNRAIVGLSSAYYIIIIAGIAFNISTSFILYTLIIIYSDVCFRLYNFSEDIGNHSKLAYLSMIAKLSFEVLLTIACGILVAALLHMRYGSH